MLKNMTKNFGIALISSIAITGALSACGKSDSNSSGSGGGSSGSASAVSYTTGLTSCPAGQSRIGWSPTCVDKTNFAAACLSVGGNPISGTVCEQSTQNFSGFGIGNTPAAFISTNPAPFTSITANSPSIPFNPGDQLVITSIDYKIGDASWTGLACNNQASATLAIRESNNQQHDLTSGSKITLTTAGYTAGLLAGLNQGYSAKKCMKFNSIEFKMVHCETNTGQVVSCN